MSGRRKAEEENRQKLSQVRVGLFFTGSAPREALWGQGLSTPSRPRAVCPGRVEREQPWSSPPKVRPLGHRVPSGLNRSKIPAI